MHLFQLKLCVGFAMECMVFGFHTWVCVSYSGTRPLNNIVLQHYFIIYLYQLMY